MNIIIIIAIGLFLFSILTAKFGFPVLVKYPLIAEKTIHLANFIVFAKIGYELGDNIFGLIFLILSFISLIVLMFGSLDPDRMMFGISKLLDKFYKW